jgi:hypothetical protein
VTPDHDLTFQRHEFRHGLAVTSSVVCPLLINSSTSRISLMHRVAYSVFSKSAAQINLFMASLSHEFGSWCRQSNVRAPGFRQAKCRFPCCHGSRMPSSGTRMNLFASYGASSFRHATSVPYHTVHVGCIFRCIKVANGLRPICPYPMLLRSRCSILGPFFSMTTFGIQGRYCDGGPLASCLEPRVLARATCSCYFL